ncbi:MAG: imidazole glycerol phosphate synthase subunit HisH [Marivivens sp.]|nr:imidazole glycerol phosphate synthase subunit HisH [Marivivens sp.]
MRMKPTSAIGIVNLPNSNVASWVHFLNHNGYACDVLRKPDDIVGHDTIILPGVGHFSNGAAYLWDTGLGDALMALHATGGVKIIGICLGMHLLYEGSCEGSGTGLGIFKGEVLALSKMTDRSTNIGWGHVDIREIGRQKVYFNHSFYVPPNREETIAHFTYRDLRFSAMVRGRNTFGIQFHPEKSYTGGLKILRTLFHEA